MSQQGKLIEITYKDTGTKDVKHFYEWSNIFGYEYLKDIILGNIDHIKAKRLEF